VGNIAHYLAFASPFPKLPVSSNSCENRDYIPGSSRGLVFKFIHAADLHLDSALSGLSRYETAPVDAIRGATRRALENLVRLAVDEQVKVVLLAGDLFDGDWKDHQTGIFLNKQFGILQRNNIRVLIVAGNHDAESKITKALKPPANVTYLSTRKPESIPLEGLDVVVHGQGYKDQKVRDNLTREYPLAVPGKFNIGMLHTSLDGRVGHATYAPCTLDDLRSRGYDYWALGHIHEREVVCESPLVVFPGCTQGRHAREIGAKGCTLVTVDENHGASIEHFNLDVVRWAQLKVDASDAQDEADLNERVRGRIKEELDRSKDVLLVPRVIVEGATSLHHYLHGRFYAWRDQVRAIGAEVGGDRIWIEQVLLATRGKESMTETGTEAESLSVLLDAIRSQDATLEAVSGLGEVVAEIKSKLPAAFIASEGGFDPASGDIVAEAIEQAKALLLSRLLKDVEP